jgi:hypothetical protein
MQNNDEFEGISSGSCDPSKSNADTKTSRKYARYKENGFDEPCILTHYSWDRTLE